MFGGRDLVMDFHGKNLVKYALEVANHLFTTEELLGNVLNANCRSQRGQLDLDRVRLIKEAIMTKYQLKGEKFDNAWQAVKSSLNQKGRNLKFRNSVRNFLERGRRDRDENGGGSGANGDGGQGISV